MKLAEKYNIPETTIKAMIKDGWISSSVPQYEEILYHYKKHIDSGKSKPQAISDAAESCRVSNRQVYRIIHLFD